MALPRRLGVIPRWLTGPRHHVSLAEVVRYVLTPTAARSAAAHIAGIARDGDFLRVTLRRTRQDLFWPGDLDLFPLYMVVTEQLHRGHWHNYEIPGMELRPDDVVVDCGAGEGLFSLLAAARVRHVYAIEPLELWHSAMRRTFAGSPGVTLIRAALAAARGEAVLTEGSLGASVIASENPGERVEVTTIDSLCIERGMSISYMKADLEGSEMEMLRGAERTIAADRPRIAITTYHRPGHAEEIRRFLTRLNSGYRISVRGINPGDGAPIMLHAR